MNNTIHVLTGTIRTPDTRIADYDLPFTLHEFKRIKRKNPLWVLFGHDHLIHHPDPMTKNNRLINLVKNPAIGQTINLIKEYKECTAFPYDFFAVELEVGKDSNTATLIAGMLGCYGGDAIIPTDKPRTVLITNIPEFHAKEKETENVKRMNPAISILRINQNDQQFLSKQFARWILLALKRYGKKIEVFNMYGGIDNLISAASDISGLKEVKIIHGGKGQ